ncbi:MAG: phage gp6-like head-tail connector protein [Chlorobiaceae bacterium]|nr:phage gp6-like head-tail connector protein [Chlorobiaceae bacterium]
MADLTTLAAVKAYLGLTTTDDDTLIASLVVGESAFIESFCSRSFSVQSYMQAFAGNGKSQWMPTWFPVANVSCLKINGVDIPAAPDINSPGWFLINETVYLNGYAFEWSRTPNCSCTYTAGMLPTYDIKQACIELVAIRHRERDRIGKSSDALAGATTSYIVKAMPDHVAAILKPYRRVTA